MSLVVKRGGAYPITLHTFRVFMCILHINGVMKDQKSRHTHSYHFLRLPYRSCLKIGNPPSIYNIRFCKKNFSEVETIISHNVNICSILTPTDKLITAILQMFNNASMHFQGCGAFNTVYFTIFGLVEDYH